MLATCCLSGGVPGDAQHRAPAGGPAAADGAHPGAPGAAPGAPACRGLKKLRRPAPPCAALPHPACALLPSPRPIPPTPPLKPRRARGTESSSWRPPGSPPTLYTVQVLLHIPGAPQPSSQQAFVYATSWWNADTVDRYLRCACLSVCASCDLCVCACSVCDRVCECVARAGSQLDRQAGRCHGTKSRVGRQPRTLPLVAPRCPPPTHCTCCLPAPAWPALFGAAGTAASRSGCP